MAAGESAHRKYEHLVLLAREYERCARDAYARADRWRLAGRTEAVVACRLEGLASRGWHVLADRRWPGTRSGNVDLVAAGPGGVLVVDVKAWAEPRIEDGRLYRGDEDCTGEVESLLALTATIEESVAAVGLPAVQVVPVIVLAGRHRVAHRLGRVQVLGETDVVEYALRRGARLTDAQVADVAAVLERDLPPYDTAVPPASPVVAQPVLPREPAQELLFDTDALVEADLAAALAAPLDVWMTWLHPDQARLVRRVWNGPARVVGPAGTGKTVVGLHRAAYLAATRPGRLLFVTYVKTLPQVLEGYYERLAPDSVERVEFTGLHAWALRLLRDRGVHCELDGRGADSAFDLAWQRVGETGPLARLAVGPRYWRDEIAWVIKGRGLTEYTSYSGLERVGRRTALRSDHRAAMWDLYETYERLLREAGIHDFNDVLAMALDEVRRAPLDPPYAAVLVDEVQDLTCVGVRLLHAVAGDRPDALLLIGDGTQAVYPGGFTLAEAGVGVVGRSVLLRTNYRNPREIVAAAARVGAAPAFDDPDGTATALVQRTGGTVRTVTEPTEQAHDARLLHALRAALCRPGVAPGEVAILVRSRVDVRTYLTLLAGAGIAAADLLTFTGREDGTVRVGTIKRAKGLEFKYVFLPRLTDGDPPREAGENDAAYRERCELARRETHVGMTRARDGLWLGYVAPAVARTA